jgi:chemotaxis protein MotB
MRSSVRGASAATGEHTDRWVVSYADFITLLFAFFVVMYAVSSVNDGKYRVLSQSLRATFGEVVAEQPGGLEAVLEQMQETREAAAEAEPEPAVRPGEGELPPEVTAEDILDYIQDTLRNALDGDLVEGKLQLKETPRGLELEFNSRLLFDSASAVLDQQYRPVLIEIAGILGTMDNAIDVEGFTDDVPIDTERFPSNWELSAARAVAVIRLLAENGVEPSRMVAVGYGPHQPAASNETPEGRARNRRVIIVIRTTGRTDAELAGGNT